MDFSRFLEVIFVEGDETIPENTCSNVKSSRRTGPPRQSWTCSVTIEPVAPSQRGHVIQCPVCWNTLKSFDALEFHLRTFHGDRSTSLKSMTYSCQECSMRFPLKALLEEHMICHISVPLEPSSLNLEQDLSSKADRKSFKCAICDKGFCSNRLLKQHGKIHDENRVRNHKCSLCSSAFFVKYKLTRHLKIHRNNDGTEKEIKSEFLTNRDMSVNESTNNVLSCSLCGQMFKSGRLLRTHKAIHARNRVRSHICPLCSKGFYVKHKLERHLQIHKRY